MISQGHTTSVPVAFKQREKTTEQHCCIAIAALVISNQKNKIIPKAIAQIFFHCFKMLLLKENIAGLFKWCV